MQRTGRGSRTFPRNDRADQFVAGEVLLQPPGLRRKNLLRRSVYAHGTMFIWPDGMPKTVQVLDETTQQKRICQTALRTSNDGHYTSQRQVRTANRKPEQQSIDSSLWEAEKPEH